MAVCYICQKAPRDPSTDGGLLCTKCGSPPHTHTLKRFQFNPGSGVAYYSCETCDYRAGPINEGKEEVPA